MRATRLVSTLIGLSACALGLSLAGEPSRQPRQPAISEQRVQPGTERPSEASHGIPPRDGSERPQGRPSDGKRSSGSAAERSKGAWLKQPQSTPGRSDQDPTGIRRAGSGPGASLHSPTWHRAAGAPTETITGKKPEPLHRQTAPSPVFKPAIRPSLPVAPSPSRGPVAVGGTMFSSAKTSGVLNGSAIKHKP